MSRIRAIKSQSRPAPAVAARVSGVPVARRATNGSTRFNFIDKSKSKKSNGEAVEIRFKEYHSLVDRSLEKSAIRINELLDPNYEKENERKLKKYALKDFLKYNKNDYFKKEALFCVTQDGYLGVDWHLTKKTVVSVIFYGKKRVDVYIGSTNRSILKKTTFNSINELLNQFDVPVN